MINTYPVLPHYIMNTDKISQNIFTYISQLSFLKIFSEGGFRQIIEEK